MDLKTLTYSTQKEAATFERVVEQSDVAYTATFNFGAINVCEDEFSTGTVFLSINGFAISHKQGAPRLPFKLERVILPPEGNYSLEIIQADFVECDMNVSPSAPLTVVSSDETPEISDIPLVDTFLPNDVVEIDREQIYRKQRFLRLLVNPIQYNPVQKKVRIYTTITYRINFELEISQKSIVKDENSDINKSPMMEALTLPSNDRIVDSILPMPPGDFYIDYESDPYHIGYLIVYAPKLKGEALRFGAWKNKTGYDVTMIEAVSANPSVIYNQIKSAYESDENIQYLLLIGDAGAIPQHSHDSDMGYACLDGSDDITPDLYYGRIPAGTLQDAKNATDKIIAYEEGKDKEGISHFVSSGFFQQGMGENDTPSITGQEYWDICYSSELLARAAEKKCQWVTRKFVYKEGETPIRWNPLYCLDEDNRVPYNILDDRTFSPKINHEDMIEVFNQNSWIIAHQDHGSVKGWEHPNFNVSSMKINSL